MSLRKIPPGQTAKLSFSLSREIYWGKMFLDVLLSLHVENGFPKILWPSEPFFVYMSPLTCAAIAQLVERIHGKDVLLWSEGEDWLTQEDSKGFAQCPEHIPSGKCLSAHHIFH